MPTVVCPVSGFEWVEVTYPDEWLMEHRDRFWKGYQKAKSDASPATKQTFGTLEWCEVRSTNGKELPNFVANFEKLPVKWAMFFDWLDDTIFEDYAKEFKPEKKA